MAIIPIHKNKMVQAALSYAAIGLHVIPCWWIEKSACACGNPDCRTPGKHPIGALVRHGQDEATTDHDTINGWWQRFPQANIGVYLAPSGLCAIDIDPRNGGFETMENLEAQYNALYSAVLQFTGGGGEHRVFAMPSGVHLPGTLGKGVDVKTNGYIMVEPSNHISGKRYDWEASSDPREGNVPSPLPDWVRDLVGVARTTTSVAMALPDAAANIISDETKADIVDALKFIPSDDRNTWVMVGMAMHACYDKQWGFSVWDDWSQSSKKYDPVDQTRVWYSFRSNKGVEKTITYLSILAEAKRAGWRVVATQKPSIDVQELKELAAHTTYERIESITSFSGIGQCPVGAVNDLTHWFTRQFEETNSLASLASALAVFSTCAARRYESSFKDPASIMLAVLSPSVSQGRYALHGTEQVLFEAGMRAMLRTTRMTSPQQLYATLHRQPSAIYLQDDYGDQLRFAKRQPSGLLDQTLTLLTGRVYAGQMLVLDNWQELGINKQPEGSAAQPIIYRPALSMLATIGTANIGHLFKATEFSKGAADSVLFIPSLNQEDWMQRPKSETSPVPANVIALIRKLRGFDTTDTTQLSADQIFGGNAGIEPTPQAVRFVGAVQQIEQSWIEAYGKAGNQIRQLGSGARRTFRRLCVTLGACTNPDDPMASEEVVAWAASFVRYCLDAAIAAANLHASQEEEKPDVYQRTLELLDQYGAEGASKRELHQGCRPYRSLTPEKRDLLIGQMIDDEEIYEVPTKSGKGKKLVRACYVKVKKAGVDAGVDASVDKTSTQQTFDLKGKN